MSRRRTHLDLETFTSKFIDPIKEDPLSTYGAHLYAEHPKTNCWLFSYKINKEPIKNIKLWNPSQVMHGIQVPALFRDKRQVEYECADLLNAIHDGETVVSHNAAFERHGWNNILIRYFPHWPKLRIAQQDCTLARANAMGFRASLENLAKDLGLHTQKDMAGAALMKDLMYREVPLITEDELYRLGLYCDDDIGAEYEADEILSPLAPTARRIWELDQKINDFGIPFDIENIERAIELVQLFQEDANVRMAKLTNGAVTAISQNVKLLQWFKARGHDQLEGVGDFDLEMLDTRGDEIAAKVVKLRRSTAKSSLAKVERIRCLTGNHPGYLDSWPKDVPRKPTRRARGQYTFMGTGPGRFSGRDAQPQNIPRFNDDKVHSFRTLLQIFEDFKTPYTLREAATVMLIDHPLEVLSDGLRGLIMAGPQCLLRDADLANIQGRVNAYLAGEDWKIEAFRAYDNGTGPDLYKVAYARAFKCEPKEVEGKRRQIGKVLELALGFEGGVGAVVQMGPTYGVQPSSLVEPIYSVTDPSYWYGLLEKYPRARDKHHLVAAEWVASKILVNSFRMTNPAITKSWANLKKAALLAVDNPDQTFIVENYFNVWYRFDREQNMLWCSLPSGRIINYANPRIKHVKKDLLEFADGTFLEVDSIDPIFAEMYLKNGSAILLEGRNRKTVTYTGKIKTKIWGDKYLYGGLQCENIVMGTEVDIFWEKLLKVDEAGFPIALHTHDSITAEINGSYSDILGERQYNEIIGSPVSFLPGLPITSKVHSGIRYAGELPTH